ncbi:MAG: VOC family protein [Leptospiraceae bacterium]
MNLERMDNVGIVVRDLSRAVEFFVALGMELQGQMPVMGQWVDQVIGLKDSEIQIAMLRVPGETTGIELMKFQNPPAKSTDSDAPPNTAGIRRIMFAVEDIEATIESLEQLGGRLIGELVQYENSYKLCYIRGPEGMMIALAEEL